jgi:hypothetical protein
MAVRKTTPNPTEAERIEAEMVAVAEGWEPEGAAAKLAYIQTHIRNVEKTGVNQHHGYNYFQEHGLMDLLRPMLRELRCALVASPGEAWERDGNRITIQGTLRFIDTEAAPDSPDREIRAQFVNEGVDTQDKATNKALTGWMKYALQKFFAVPTQEVADADHSDVKQAQAHVASKPDELPPGSQKVSAENAQRIAASMKAAVEAGQLDGNKVKAKLSTFKKKNVSDLTEDQANELWDYCEAEITKAKG